MKNLLMRSVISILLLQIVYAHDDLPSALTKLHDTVLRDYHRSVPPMHNGAVNVDLGFNLVDFDLDDTTGKITVHAISDRVWTDKRIMWKPEEYNDTQSVLVNDWYVWKPDIVMWNSGKSEETLDADVLAYYNGTMMQFQSLQSEFTCRMNFRYFPFDEQECYLVFGSWHHHEGILNITDGVNAVTEFYDYLPSTDFKLNKVSAHKESYPFGDEMYSAVMYIFKLERISSAYSVKLVLPAVLSGFMVLATFLLPPASYEKITLCGLLFVGILLQLIYIHDVVPASGETMLADFLVFAMFIDGFATVAAVMSYHIFIRSSEAPTEKPSIFKTEGDDNDLRIQMPANRKARLLRHLDLALFLLFTFVFIVGLAIILGNH